MQRRTRTDVTRSEDYDDEYDEAKDVETGRVPGTPTKAYGGISALTDSPLKGEFSKDEPSEATGAQDPVTSYDPVSLKEPPELHSWKWIGLPEHWLRYCMHKVVLEVDGRDQVCGLIFWQVLLLGFICYSILLFKDEVDQRNLPPQSVSYITKGPLMKHLERLPIMAVCPVVVPSRKPNAPKLHWGWDLQVLTEGYTDDNLQPDGRTSLLNVTRYRILDDRKHDCLAVNQSCLVLDGKTYSEHFSRAYHKLPVDQRIVLFRFFLFLLPPEPGDPPFEPNEQSWLSMTVWLLTAWDPEEVCTEKGYSADRATHVPLQEMTSSSTMPMTEGVRVRLKRLNRLGPMRLFGSGSQVEEFSYEVINAVATLSSSNHLSLITPLLPKGARVFERAIRVNMSPVIINREEIETVNVWATLGVIAGAWSGFMLLFKLTFPSRPSGYRRLIKPLRALSHRMMPKHVTTHLERFEQSLGVSTRNLSRQSSGATATGDSRDEPPAVTTLAQTRADQSGVSIGTMVRAWRRRLSQGMTGGGGGGEGNGSRASSSNTLGSRPLGWWGRRKGDQQPRTLLGGMSSRRLLVTQSSAVMGAAAHIELPALDTRVFQLEQVVKAMVDREAKLRRRHKKARPRAEEGGKEHAWQ